MAKVYKDLLDEDKPIGGQKFVCLSFISPEKILKDKNLFFFEKFLKYFDFEKSIKKFSQFLEYLSFKYNIKNDEIETEFKDFIKTQEKELLKFGIEGEYKNFLDKEEEKCQEEFNKINNFKTNTRGVKVRGVFQTQEEAQLRCKLLREIDPTHDIYVGQVGMWLPFEPNAYKTGKVDYLEEELNKLMYEKQKNEKNAKIAFEKRVKDAKRKAIEDNIEKAKKSGNKLTQTINKNGDLIGVGINTIENKLKHKQITTSDDIRKELFEGENIRTKASDKLKEISEENEKI